MWVILLSIALAGVLREILKRKGWWFDWEKLDEEDREKKLVWRAYKQWRDDAGPAKAADVRARLESLADSSSKSRSIDDGTS